MKQGIREGDRVQLLDEGLLGRRVVTLGQQMVEDGTRVSIPVVEAGDAEDDEEEDDDEEDEAREGER